MTSPGGADPARPQWPVAALATMAVAVFLSVTTELLPTGLLPAMSRDLGVSEGRLGLLVTGFALMVALFATPLGVLVARLPRRWLLFWAMLGYAACNLVTAVSDAYPLTVAARLIGGITHGMFWGMLGSYAGRIVSPDRVGRAVTIVSGRGRRGGPARRAGRHRAGHRGRLAGRVRRVRRRRRGARPGRPAPAPHGPRDGPRRPAPAAPGDPAARARPS